MSTFTPTESPVRLDPGECRALLERIVNSRELKRALRLRELVYFLGNRSLQPNPGALREQEIGAAVFGRPEEYDTNLDNIVRVNVSELRKRLSHYFQDEGADEKIILEIPRGGYLPVFCPRLVMPAEEKANEFPPLENGTAVEAEPHTVPEAVSEELLAETTPHSRTIDRSGLVWILGIALICTLVAAAALLFQNRQLRAKMQPWRTDPVRASFWSEFFASGDEVDIVTADTSFALAEDLLGSPISLDDYLDYKYKSFSDEPGLTPERRALLNLVLDRNNGSIGDFQAAERFLELDAHSPALKLASARSYTPEGIKTNNVILIGARESNPWVDLYRSRMNFFLDYEPSNQRSFIVNRNPLPGEKKVYEALQDRNRAYSVVSFLPNLSEGRYVLIISGTDSQATRAAGEFVTSSEGLAQIQRIKPGKSFPYFEVVLSSSRLVGTTLDTEILASRVWAR